MTNQTLERHSRPHGRLAGTMEGNKDHMPEAIGDDLSMVGESRRMKRHGIAPEF